MVGDSLNPYEMVGDSFNPYEMVGNSLIHMKWLVIP